MTIPRATPEDKALGILRGLADAQGWTCGTCGITWAWGEEPASHDTFAMAYEKDMVVAP